jgi:RHS repeat-associated protein
VPEDYGFTQKERDQESALAYFDVRYLTTLHGRFLSPDPLVEVHNTGIPQSWNCYACTLNNPVKYTDPHGLYVLDTSVNADQAKAIEQAFKDAREAAGKIENAADRNLLLRALDAYKGNNVTIGIDPSLADKAAARTSSEKEAGKFRVNFVPGLSGPHLLKQVAHEGSHLADKEAGLVQTTYDSEKKAYTVESIVFQGRFLSQSATDQKTSDYRVLHYEKRIWDFHWQTREEIENKRSAAIDLVLAKPKSQRGHYEVTRESPGPKAR